MREYIESIWGWHEEWQEEYFRRKFDPKGRQIIVIDGQDAGVLVLEERPDEVYLSLIELWPEFQGHGVGTEIIRGLLRHAHNRELPLVLDVLRSNNEALRLYERLGFKVVSEDESRFRMICPPEDETPAGNGFPIEVV